MVKEEGRLEDGRRILYYSFDDEDCLEESDDSDSCGLVENADSSR